MAAAPGRILQRGFHTFFLLGFNVRGVGRPGGGLNVELLWRTPRSIAASRQTSSRRARDAANGSSAEKAIQNIETNVPARGAPSR